MPTTPQSVVTKAPSFLDKLQQTVFLDYVLKVLGIVLLGWGLFNCWKDVGVPTRFLLIAGPVAWYVGARFAKIYR